LPRSKRHYRVSLAEVLSAHERALRLGGLEGVRDLGLIESAIARPYNGYYRRLHQKAAALVESLSRNHGFVDGNKRTTLIMADLLIGRSGYELVALGEEDLGEALELLILRVVARELDVEAAAEWFRLRLRVR